MDVAWSVAGVLVSAFVAWRVAIWEVNKKRQHYLTDIMRGVFDSFVDNIEGPPLSYKNARNKLLMYADEGTRDALTMYEESLWAWTQYMGDTLPKNPEELIGYEIQYGETLPMERFLILLDNFNRQLDAPRATLRIRR